VTAVKIATVAVELSLTKSAILTTFETDLRKIKIKIKLLVGGVFFGGVRLQKNSVGQQITDGRISKPRAFVL
jgi:hypothetical protein